MRTADEVVRLIHASLGDGEKQGLRNTAALLEILDAWPSAPVVHVAGTNGKGSVCAMTERVMRQAGYRTGMYTSPYLQTYHERIRINGRPISDRLLVKYGSQVLEAAEKLKTSKGIHCTPFELGTVLALFIFLHEQTDILILEAGMGGRLDPTNVVREAAVCGITAIGMDHMRYLGNTIEEIAGEKAGILKFKTPAVCYPFPDNVRAVFRNAAEKSGAVLIQTEDRMITHIQADLRGSTATYQVGEEGSEKLRLSLPGIHQTRNALVVLGILHELQRQEFRISEEDIRIGLADTAWPGRLEWYGNILMDGAHNSQGTEALKGFLEQHPIKGPQVLLTGILKEKQSEELLRLLASIGKQAVTVTPFSPRALPGEELAALLREKGCDAQAAPDLSTGLQAARKAAGKNGRIIATGSLYFIGELRTELGLAP